MRRDLHTRRRFGVRWWAALTVALALAVTACSEPQTAMPDPAITANDFVIAALGSSDNGSGAVESLRESTVSGIVEVNLSERDYVAKVDYYLGGKGNLVENATEAPYSLKIDTRKLSNGTHLLIARTWVRTGDSLVPFEFDVEFKVRNGKADGDDGSAAGATTASTTGSGGDGSGSGETEDAAADPASAAGGSAEADTPTAEAGNGAAGKANGAGTDDGPGDTAGEPDEPAGNAAAAPATADQTRGTPNADGSMRGDPSFDVTALDEAAAAAHEQLLKDAREARPALRDGAARGDLHFLARDANQHVTELLAAFRESGDLRLLDAIDPILQAARGALADTNGDGFRNWRWLKSSLDAKYLDDADPVEEALTHGMVAAVAWAYQSNRDLASPSSVNYGERADFWRSYLKHDFEAKWRLRSRETAGGTAFLDPQPLHAFVQQTRYLWHVGGLTQDAAYLAAAEERGERIAEAIAAAGGLPWSLAPGGSDPLPEMYSGLTVLTLDELAQVGLEAARDVVPPESAEASAGD